MFWATCDPILSAVHPGPHWRKIYTQSETTWKHKNQQNHNKNKTSKLAAWHILERVDESNRGPVVLSCSNHLSSPCCICWPVLYLYFIHVLLTQASTFCFLCSFGSFFVKNKIRLQRILKACCKTARITPSDLSYLWKLRSFSEAQFVLPLTRAIQSVVSYFCSHQAEDLYSQNDKNPMFLLLLNSLMSQCDFMWLILPLSELDLLCHKRLFFNVLSFCLANCCCPKNIPQGIIDPWIIFYYYGCQLFFLRISKKKIILFSFFPGTRFSSVHCCSLQVKSMLVTRSLRCSENIFAHAVIFR